jgi:hypothetical protein
LNGSSQLYTNDKVKGRAKLLQDRLLKTPVMAKHTNPQKLRQILESSSRASMNFFVSSFFNFFASVQNLKGTWCGLPKNWPKLMQERALKHAVGVCRKLYCIHNFDLRD